MSPGLASHIFHSKRRLAIVEVATEHKPASSVQVNIPAGSGIRFICYRGIHKRLLTESASLPEGLWLVLLLSLLRTVVAGSASTGSGCTRRSDRR
jgi:hypothetical protein